MGAVIGRVTVETPEYTVLTSTPDYEVRRYGPQLAASHIGSTRSGDAFRALAAYCGIFADPKQVDDAAKKPIAMTAPVLMELPEDHSNAESVGSTTKTIFMAFLLPAQFKRVEDAPKPLDQNITVIQLPDRILAVHTFSGNLSPRVFAEKVTFLKDTLAKDSVVVKNEKPMCASYNPPFTIPFLKKNEVMLAIDASTVPTRSASLT